MITISQVTDANEIELLFEAYRAFYNQVPSEAARRFLHERIASGESTAFVMKDGGMSIGFAQLYPVFSSLQCKKAYILNDLYVTAAYRNKGLGAQLITAVFDYAKQQGACYVTLETADTNFSAKALYKKVGMTVDYMRHYTKTL